jgi:hypothetical protein
MVALALGSLIALSAAGVAVATHEHPASATTFHTSLVPAFNPCSNANVNGQHSPPLAVGSCGPPAPTSGQARTGPNGTSVANVDVIPGDVQLSGTSSDIETPAGADYAPAGTGDLLTIARIRFTDHYNCFPAGCGGPYTSSGTGQEVDFGPVPVDCVPNGSPATPPGSDCNVSTSANTVVPGSIVAGREAVVQVFRIRVNDIANTIFGQQGVFIP